MEVLNKNKGKVEPLKINVKFWGWFHVGAAVVGIAFFLVADGRMWGRLNDRGLYDVMMQIGGLGYLLIWGLAFLKVRRVKLAFSFSSASVFCYGVSFASLLKQLALSSQLTH